MNCFFKIWKASAFRCRDPNSNIAVLPLSVQAQLRNIARHALVSLEHDILKELDDCVTQQGNPKPQERLAIWVSMWQLILMYREILLAFDSHVAHLERSSRDTMKISEQQHKYKKLCDHFFPMLTVFYHYQFRTKKSLDALSEWVKPTHSSTSKGACDSRTIRHIAQALLDARKDKYLAFQSSSREIDRLLCVFVINHEMKKLSARKRTSKTSSRSKTHVRTGEDDDECDD
jgi:hypothetical protein